MVTGDSPGRHHGSGVTLLSNHRMLNEFNNIDILMKLATVKYEELNIEMVRFL